MSSAPSELSSPIYTNMSWTPNSSTLRAPVVRRPMITLPERALAGLSNGMPLTSADSQPPTSHDGPSYYSDSDGELEEVANVKANNVSPISSPRPSRTRRASRQSSRLSSPRKARIASGSKIQRTEVLQSISCTPGLREQSIEVSPRIL
jgi:hypothetical protein